MAEASGTTFLDPDDGSLMLDTDGSVRLADGVSDDCCCGGGGGGCPYPTIKANLTNLSWSGCSWSNPCDTPDAAIQGATRTELEPYECYYISDGAVLCWDGFIWEDWAVWWNGSRWVMDFLTSSGDVDALLNGPTSRNGGNPSGTYTPISPACVSGTVEISLP